MRGWSTCLAASNALQWAAFGATGGLAISRGGRLRPALRVGLALVAVCFIRSLYLALRQGRGGEEALVFIPFDLAVAIGWGVGLLLCPAATAALRPPEAR